MEEQTSNQTPSPEPTPAPAPQPAPQAPAGTTHTVSNPTHGMNGPMPDELKRWSWAAFLMNWLWGISHNVWIALLCFVPFLNIVMPFYLGVKGNELAWEHRKFESVEQFKEVQRKWMYWGIGVFVASIVFFMMMWSFIFAFLVGSSLNGVDGAPNFYDGDNTYEYDPSQFQ
jgi:hypothetical protein